MPSWKMNAVPRKMGGLCFLGIVLLGYVLTIWYGGIDLSTFRGQLCLACGVAYALAGFFCSDCDDTLLPGWSGPLLFFVLFGLLAGILFTSHMNGEIYLCIFPLVAVALKLLPPFASAAAELCVAALVVGALARFQNPGSVVRNSLSILSACTFVIIFTLIAIRATKARQNAERLSLELEDANQRLRAQSAQMAEMAIIRERNRLARDIHDGLGHYLTTIHVQLEAARALYPSDAGRALAAVVKAHGLAREALLEVRRSVGWLKEDAPARALGDRLRDLAASTDGPMGLSVEFEVLGEAKTLDAETELGLFRTAQEALTNVCKHAAARNAKLVIDYRDAGRVAIRVLDDGRGCARAEGGHGITGLRERIALLGGEVWAQNEPGGGFRLETVIPAKPGLSVP